MTVKDLVKTEIDKLPENLLVEVLDFIRFIETRAEKDMLARASQDLTSTDASIKEFLGLNASK
jgi:hypothetical protein